jgi:LPXTG-motif cell wall-anchored protein
VNPFKSALHRTTAVLAGTFLGLAGAVALAAPASAHHPIIEPTSACVAPDGSWKVSWKLSNSEDDLEARVSEVNLNPDDSTITGIAVDNKVPKWGTGELTGVQTLPATAKRAVLRVTLIWDRPDEDVVVTDKGKLDKPTIVCPTPPTSPSPSPSESSPSPSPSPSQSSASPSPSVSTTPPSSTPTPSQSTTPPPPSDEPEFVYEQTCDTLTVGVDNPATGKPETVTFTPSVGEPKTVTAAPGEVKTVDFPASEGLTVEAVPQSAPDEAATIAYQAPADCDDSGNGGGDLPLTGVAVGGIAAGAGLLLAAGVVLFVMARRRKVKFTA